MICGLHFNIARMRNALWVKKVSIRINDRDGINLTVHMQRQRQVFGIVNSNAVGIVDADVIGIFCGITDIYQ
jgi:hypothetical protein